MAKDTFIFYIDWFDVLEELQSEGMRNRLYRAIPVYAFTGQEPEDAAEKIVFSFIRKQIDRNAEKYQRTIEKRREAGRKHKGNQYTRATLELKNQIGTNGTSVPSVPKNGTNGTNGTDNDNVYVNDNVLKEKELTKVSEKKSAAEAASLLQKRREKFYKDLIPYVSTYGKQMVREFFDYWTEPNKSKTKMRYELERTWDLNRRVRNWASREKFNNSNGSNKTTSTAEQRANAVAEQVAALLDED